MKFVLIFICLVLSSCRYVAVTDSGCLGCSWVLRQHRLIPLAELGNAQAVQFEAADGTALSGFLTNAHHRRRLILFVPGKHGSARFQRYRPHYETFLGMGYDVLAVNPRGYGPSAGEAAPPKLGQDVAAAVRYARQRFSGAQLALYGIGIGTAGLSAYAAEEQGGPEAPCLPLVLESPVLSWPEMFANYDVQNSGEVSFAEGLNVNTRQQFAGIRCPSLLLVEGQGLKNPPRMIQDYFEAIPATEKELFRAPLARHASWPTTAPARLDSALRAFLPGS